MAAIVSNYQGKPLSSWLESVRGVMLNSTAPLSVENAMTQAGLTDNFVRKLVGRAYRQTLKEGGANYDLTQNRRWAKVNERWAPEGIGKSTAAVTTFRPTTEATDQLTAQIEELNGQLSPEAQTAGMNIATVFARTAGKTMKQENLDEATGEVSNLLASNAALNRELQVHQEYRKELAEYRQMIQRLMDDRLGTGTGTSVRR